MRLFNVILVFANSGLQANLVRQRWHQSRNKISVWRLECSLCVLNVNERDFIQLVLGSTWRRRRKFESFIMIKYLCDIIERMIWELLAEIWENMTHKTLQRRRKFLVCNKNKPQPSATILIIAENSRRELNRIVWLDFGEVENKIIFFGTFQLQWSCSFRGVSFMNWNNISRAWMSEIKWIRLFSI